MHRLAANRVRLADGLLALGRVNDQRELAVLDHVDDVRATFADLVDALTRHAAIGERLRGAARRHDLEAAGDEHLAELDDTGLVAITDADEREPAPGKHDARRDL